MQGFLNGTHFFIVVAHNENGDTLSNGESVNVAIIPGGDRGPTNSIPGYSIILLLVFSAFTLGLKIRKKTRT